MSTQSGSQITAEEFRQVLREGLPSGAAMPLDVVRLERGVAVVRCATGPSDLRPGGTLAGPVLFWLADLAMYAAVMTVVGRVPLAVTTDATIHFLRPSRPGTLVARARIIKEGKRLVVGDVLVSTEDAYDAPLAHIVLTYSVPQPSG